MNKQYLHLLSSKCPTTHPNTIMMVMVKKRLFIEFLPYVVLIAIKEVFSISFFFSISSDKVITINIYS